jgi:subtilisin family serine protease
MRREYLGRGRVVEIEELDDIVAVKPREPGVSRQALARAFGSIASAPTAVRDRQAWKAFEGAGWVFVHPSQTLRRSLEEREAVEGAEAVQRVFVNPGGRVLLGTDLLTVRLREDLTETDVASELDVAGLEVVRELRFAPNLYEARTRSGRDFLDVSVESRENPAFLYAEPVFIEHIPPRFVPTDPDYGQQWHLNNTGQDGGTAGADIAAEQAWDTTRGGGVRLAVVDNGFDIGHDDLTAALAPTSGYFQMDATGNTVFVQGLGAGFPDNNHGTFCAGMAVARANNGEGGCGVANLTDFIAVACLGDQVGTQVTLARAIAYAADPTQEVPGANPDEGADVISSSLGPNNQPWDMTQVLQDASDFAVTNGRSGLGTPIFWATDNANVPVAQDEVLSYANTIAVGRSTRDDLEDNSAFGPELDFLATGVDVYSTTSGGGYGTDTGTSFAAPTAAGVGALVLAVNPALTWQRVRDVIRETCDKIGGVTYDATGHNDDYGFGRVTAARALALASQAQADWLTPVLHTMMR